MTAVFIIGGAFLWALGAGFAIALARATSNPRAKLGAFATGGIIDAYKLANPALGATVETRGWREEWSRSVDEMIERRRADMAKVYNAAHPDDPIAWVPREAWEKCAILDRLLGERAETPVCPCYVTRWVPRTALTTGYLVCANCRKVCS